MINQKSNEPTSAPTKPSKPKYRPMLVTTASLKLFRKLPRDNMLVVALLFSVLGSYVYMESRAATPTPTEPKTAMSGYGAIKSKASPDMCLTITAKGKAAKKSPCNGGNGQQWKQLPAGGGAVTIEARNGLCLSTPPGRTVDGTQIIANDCKSSGSLTWALDPAKHLIHRDSGKCLAGPAGQSDTSILTLRTCDSIDPTLLWFLQ